ncbi:LysM peptidoglycan-binding domain-containing protein [Paenibacillus daejeonensis]|uniref:LysM peptidoglycan-binding domain-containing protein n=1 Tax=Paenibacillus daejeonensis TaxID=135193 RepID=UPI000380546D|nr:LysM peptidoglycan-binding domain-containing protein [Paenibacillus daejeonensis]
MIMQTTSYRSIHVSNRNQRQSNPSRWRRLSVSILPKVAVIAVVIAILMSGVLLVDSYANPATYEPLAHETMVIVSSGDTLWSIAKTHMPENMDVREAIYLLQSRNGISNSSLVSGQSLIIPF